MAVNILPLDAELHADQEAELSMINLRPSFGNRSRGVDDPAIREAIARLVHRLVRP